MYLFQKRKEHCRYTADEGLKFIRWEWLGEKDKVSLMARSLPRWYFVDFSRLIVWT
jgi:hypothetical protein